jgi:hypothetical protein
VLATVLLKERLMDGVWVSASGAEKAFAWVRVTDEA